ncbi:MAG: hypothetical protein ACOX1F_06975 [Erysipelotrichaceae bacterium]|jgi:alpha-galactosidase
MINNKIREFIKDQLMKQPEIIHSFDCGRVSFDFYDNNAVMYKLDGININWFFSSGKTRDGRFFSSKTAKKTSYRIAATKNGYTVSFCYAENDITFVQHLITGLDNPFFICQLEVKDELKETETNYLIPLDFGYPSNLCLPLFSSLESKILLCPYDNDMWVRYEITYLKSGRTSYDVSAIFDTKSLNGMVLGSIDNNIWKNGIVCSEYDARCLRCISGIADGGTHDSNSHGYLSGRTVTSDRFVCGYFEDIRDGLIYYGKLAQNKKGLYKYNGPVPFGWNSYSALGIDVTLDHYEEAADFLYHQLNNFTDSENVTFINLDGNIGLSKHRLKRIIKKLHKRNQKAGTYMFPLCHMDVMNLLPLKGTLLKFRKDIVLKQPDNSSYFPVDGKLPIDITIPEAERDFRLQLREIIDIGFDYIKFDFLSHGALEGQRHNKNIKTGRQALMYFYNILKEELDPEKTGKEIFVDFSISPLFPSNYAHGRRCCCDCFGHIEDIKYVLNSLTFGFWTNNYLYQYSDPDHTVLYSSVIDKRGISSFHEAKSRYNASVISGTVMLLSDNYGPDIDNPEVEPAKQRAILLANNENLNRIARFNRAFLPVKFEENNNLFFLCHQGHTYGAVFNFENEIKTYKLKPELFNFHKSGILLNINDNTSTFFNDEIMLTLDRYDSIVFELKEK